MKKFLALFIGCLIFGIFNLVEAKEVTVEGVGADRENALRDARRVAVEEVVGTFVDSRTLTRNNMLVLDDIYLKSTGFIGKVEILSEGVENGFYKVRAVINVDQNPSAEILRQVQAVMALNDPRIAVSVLKANSTVHESAIESAIIDRLVEMNFSHVVDSNAEAEFMILGECRTTFENIKIPDFKGGYYDTGLNRGQTEMVTKIIRLDTGEVLESFSVSTSGIGEGDKQAESAALKNMANQVGEKVEEKFRRIGARNSFS